MPLGGTFDDVRNATTFATPGDHADALENADYANADQTNAKSDTGFVTAGPTAPTGITEAGVAIPYAGVGWQDTGAHANGPSQQTKFYNGADSVFIAAAEAIYSTNAPASGYEKPSMLWRDETLHLWRRYESATTAPNGVAGWHPLAEAYQLWRNESGGTIPKGAVVVHKPDGTVQRAMMTSATPLAMGVVGVTSETITSNAYGILATLAAGAQIMALVNVATYGAGDKGDCLVVDASAGYGRQRGLLPANFFSSATQRVWGVPVGAYAELLTAVTVTGLAQVRLLGGIGQGAHLLRPNGTGLLTNSSATLSGTGTTAADISCTGMLVDAAHDPMVAAIVGRRTQAKASLDGSTSITSGGVIWDTYPFDTVTGDTMTSDSQLMVPTSATPTVAASAPGNSFRRTLSINSGGNDASVAFRPLGYIY